MGVTPVRVCVRACQNVRECTVRRSIPDTPPVRGGGKVECEVHSCFPRPRPNVSAFSVQIPEAANGPRRTAASHWPVRLYSDLKLPLRLPPGLLFPHKTDVEHHDHPKQQE